MRQQLTLGSAEKRTTGIEIENTHKRSFKDPIDGYTCDLPENVEGVIWNVKFEGVEAPANAFLILNEKGHEFKQICRWQAAPNVTLYQKGKVIYDGALTEFLVAGPDDSKTLKISFSNDSVEIEIHK
ncbi:MAG: hypothetical protein D3910_25095 [Candidatus Electrothrix sp. ATG2]|nr:hypothetical protein [Candidatus Electrothrix sp. ATG2]